MRVRWAAGARRDRLKILHYIAENNPQAAVRMDVLFTEAADRLARHPAMGRPGKMTGTRELIPHENYRLVYEIEDKTIWVLALLHTSRRWPPEGGKQQSPNLTP